MPAQGELRGPKAESAVPSARHGGGDWDQHGSDVAASEKPVWKAPSAEELQLSRARQWALATQHDKRAQVVLMAGVCAVCGGKILRNVAMKPPLLVITPWLHMFATTHEPVLRNED